MIGLATLALAADLPEISGSYTDARQVLMAEGWEPLTTDDSDCVNNMQTKSCQMFPEIRFCASSGPCQMTWQRGSEIVTVDTFGDDVVGVRDGLVP